MTGVAKYIAYINIFYIVHCVLSFPITYQLAILCMEIVPEDSTNPTASG